MIRLPWEDQSDPIWMPRYTPGTARLEGMERRGRFRPNQERVGGQAFVDQLKQQATMADQSNRLATNRAGFAHGSTFNKQRPDWLRRVLFPEQNLPKGLQKYTPAALLSQASDMGDKYITAPISRALGHAPKGPPVVAQEPREEAALLHFAASRGIPLSPQHLQFLSWHQRMTQGKPTRHGRV